MRCFGYGAEQAPVQIQSQVAFLCHIILDLETDCRNHGPAVNPLSASCQMPEDFINKVSTLTRSVQPRRMPESTIDKYQICVAKIV